MSRRQACPGKVFGTFLLVAALSLTACATSEPGGDGVVAEYAVPVYLEPFIASDGLLTVSQSEPVFADSLGVTYLVEMVESLTGAPFVDEDLAQAAENDTPTEAWAVALQGRLAGRLRGDVAVPTGSGLSWEPELAGVAGSYLPAAALLSLDLGVDPGRFSADGDAGAKAQAEVANWVISGTADRARAADRQSWAEIVEAGPDENYQRYLIAGTALVLAGSEAERDDAVQAIGDRLREDRGVDDVPWLLPEADEAEKGYVSAGLAGIYFDLAASGGLGGGRARRPGRVHDVRRVRSLTGWVPRAGTHPVAGLRDRRRWPPSLAARPTGWPGTGRRR